MNNKAFTLVELLGVIVLLGILGIVIIPKVGDSISNSKETALITQEEQIKKAARDFLVDNTEFLEENDTITIKLGTLKQKGYLPINIKNPKTRKNISNESLITITRKNDTYTIKLTLIDLQDVTENIDNNSPILVLNGDYIEYVEVNELYQEKGALAKTSTGETINNISIQIKQNNTEKTTIDTTQLLTYNVIYSVTDSNGLTTSATRTVIVRDTKTPIITFPTETTLHVSEVADFNALEGITITDNYTTAPEVTLNSSLAALPGKYVITYTVKDSSNNQTIERRVINVNDDWSKYYTNVEYIQSTGTQYITTDIVPNNTMGIYAKLSSQDIDNDLVYFGSKGNGNTRFWIGNNYNNLYHGWNTNIEPDNRPRVIANHIHEIKMNYLNDRSDYLDNTLIKNNLETLGNNSIPITIFAGNNNGTNAYKSKIRLYNLKISEGNKVKYNLIPCYRNSDKEIGLYDLINNRFYINVGSEKLKYKELNESFNNYQRLSYIQGTGTQYIDTEYYLNSNNINIKTKIYTPNMPTDEQDILSNQDDSTGRFVLGLYGKTVFGYSRNVSSSYENNVVSSTFNGANTLDIEADYNYSTHQKTLTVNGNTTTSSYNAAISNSNVSIQLFKQANANNLYYSGKLYSMQITVDGVLIRDFVPCYRKTDGVAGLYDLVNDVFYENVGTGEFVKGDPIN